MWTFQKLQSTKSTKETEEVLTKFVLETFSNNPQRICFKFICIKKIFLQHVLWDIKILAPKNSQVFMLKFLVLKMKGVLRCYWLINNYTRYWYMYQQNQIPITPSSKPKCFLNFTLSKKNTKFLFLTPPEISKKHDSGGGSKIEIPTDTVFLKLFFVSVNTKHVAWLR